MTTIQQNKKPVIGNFSSSRPAIVYYDSDSEYEDLEIVSRCCIPSCKNKKSKLGNKSFCKKHNEKYKFDKPKDCPICLEKLNDKYPLLNCGHWIHHNCVIQSGKAECPICRTSVKFTREQKKEMNKQIMKRIQENLEEEQKEIRQMLEEEGLETNERGDDCFYNAIKYIYQTGLVEESIQEILDYDEFILIDDLDLYIDSEYREMVEKDLKKLSRHRDRKISHTAKCLKTLLENDEEMIILLLQNDIDDLCEIKKHMLETIVKNEYKAYEFVKRQLFIVNY
jgi:uncharacterized Zn finger protein (UPF0148 family)